MAHFLEFSTGVCQALGISVLLKWAYTLGINLAFPVKKFRNQNREKKYPAKGACKEDGHQ